MEFLSIEIEDELPAIGAPVMILFGQDGEPMYARIETARRVMTNETDWYWYGFANNSMRLDVKGWCRLPEDSTCIGQTSDIEVRWYAGRLWKVE